MQGIALIAVFCAMSMSPSQDPSCVNEIIARSEWNANLTMTSCQGPLSAFSVIQYKNNHPIYSSDNWAIKEWKCSFGVPKEADV